VATFAERAAKFLAGWALLRSDAKPKSARLITVLRNDSARFLTVRTLAIYTDNGTTARLDSAQYDKAELTSIMSGLLNPHYRSAVVPPAHAGLLAALRSFS
jgi:hypothetical protein